jgi:hypothetical protein
MDFYLTTTYSIALVRACSQNDPGIESNQCSTNKNEISTGMYCTNTKRGENIANQRNLSKLSTAPDSNGSDDQAQHQAEHAHTPPPDPTA